MDSVSAICALHEQSQTLTVYCSYVSNEGNEGFEKGF